MGRLMRSLPAALAAAIAIFVLSTCSNGVDFRAEVVDEVMKANDLYLEVVEVTPFKNQTEVNTYGSLLIEFDREIDLDTVSDSTISITPATTWTPSFDPLTRILSITPEMLESVTAYTVSVSEEVMGTDGSSLRDPYAWSFTTKQGPGGTVTISSAGPNQEYTATSSVNLAITANFVTTRYRVSPNDPPTFDPADTDWLDKSTTGSTTLPAGNGLKTVYIQFMDASNNRTPITAISDTITLDTSSPTATSITVAAGATYTTSTSVSLGIVASDTGSGLYQMQFSNNGTTYSTYESYSATKAAWTLISGDGSKTVYLRVRDMAGNTSTTPSDSITLDQTAPTISTFTIGSGDPATTNSLSVTLYITATDATSGPYQMSFWTGIKGDFWTTYQAYAGTKAWTLLDKAGTRRVYVRVKDNAGNETPSTTTTATYDEIILNARIAVTYSQLYISNDGDNDPIVDGYSGEIYYSFLIDGVTKLNRPVGSAIQLTSPTSLTGASLGSVLSYTIYENPTSGSFLMEGAMADDDTLSADEVGTMSSITYSAPFADVTSASRPITGGVAGTIYYSIDFVNP